MKNGDEIVITWLPTCKNARFGTKNPYIGMKGVIVSLNEQRGQFDLFTGTSWLCGVKTGFFNLKFKIINNKVCS